MPRSVSASVSSCARPARRTRVRRLALRAAPHLLLAAGLCWQLVERRALDGATVPVVAEVLTVGPVPQLLGGTQQRAVLAFRDRDGRRFEVLADPDDRGVGQGVPLRYDPAWPARVRADGFASRWGGVLALLAAWTATVALRLGLGLRRRCRDRDAVPQPG